MGSFSQSIIARNRHQPLRRTWAERQIIYHHLLELAVRSSTFAAMSRSPVSKIPSTHFCHAARILLAQVFFVMATIHC
jgi:hypothetical protein